jgi:hypothetical protein
LHWLVFVCNEYCIINGKIDSSLHEHRQTALLSPKIKQFTAMGADDDERCNERQVAFDYCGVREFMGMRSAIIHAL